MKNKYMKRYEKANYFYSPESQKSDLSIPDRRISTFFDINCPLCRLDNSNRDELKGVVIDYKGIRENLGKR